MTILSIEQKCDMDAYHRKLEVAQTAQLRRTMAFGAWCYGTDSRRRLGSRTSNACSVVDVIYAGTHQSPRGLDYTKIEYKKYYLLQQLVGFVCFSTYTTTTTNAESD